MSDDEKRRAKQHEREREHAGQPGGDDDDRPAIVDATGLVEGEALITEAESRPTDERGDPFLGPRHEGHAKGS